ncbi:MAG: hypothetical protein JXB62_20260 [Pirellulales bacterium]|nr:hypothetical protein [Pirellulales bacterium]
MIDSVVFRSPLALFGDATRVTMCIAALIATAAAGEQPPENIALRKPYSLHPAPDYRHCTDPADATQLTDGQTTDAYFWTQPGTVGWQSARYAIVTVDLKQTEPISGAAFRTAAGRAGVQWPGAIRILTSDDGKAYFDVGDLVRLDHEVHGPWPEGYAIRRLVTAKLRTRGRYVRFLVLPGPGSPFTFVDEVEVFRGPPELLGAERAGPPADEPDVAFARWRVQAAVKRRFRRDIAAIGRTIGEADEVAAPARGQLERELVEAGRALLASEVSADSSFRAILPFDEAHQRLYQVQASLWRAQGQADLVCWVPAVWDPLDPFSLPPRSAGSMAIDTMMGEYRAAALNLANSTDKPLALRLSFEGLPGSPTPDYVTVHEVAWTDTSSGLPVAAALPEASRAGDDWRVTVLPGLPRQVWMTFHVASLPAGTHRGAVVVRPAGGAAVRTPVLLRVYPLSFPERTTLLLGGWSYTDGPGSYGITPRNREAFVQHLKQHGVNAPWATSGVMMRHQFSDDARVALDTRQLDQWIAEWPQAARYHVFLSIGSYSSAGKRTFAGADIGTPEFDRRVGAWISAWVRHLKGRGIAPARLALLLHDEPHEGTDVGPLLAWAKAIHTAEPDVLIWEDPTYRDPAGAPAALFEAADVLCPNRPMWLAQGRPFGEFYLDQRHRGRELQFYSCSGPARLLDPYSYYRLQAWQCWQTGATGTFFWALGDNSGASSWNPYLAKAGPYTPLFLDDTTVTAGKQMEAIRESVQDYEYLVMLHGAVEKARAAGRADAVVDEAETLLETAAEAVLGAEGAARLWWREPKDRTAADKARVQVLESLTALSQ